MRITESTAGPRLCRGIVDDSNREFGTQNVVFPGSLDVYLNGVLQTEGVSYILKLEILGNIEMLIAPSSSTPDIITFKYDALGVSI